MSWAATSLRLEQQSSSSVQNIKILRAILILREQKKHLQIVFKFEATKNLKL